MDKPKTPGYIVPVARRLRTGQTSAEQVLWTCLRNRRLGGAKFRRQHPIGRYIADFYCHEALLAVELEGNVHDEANQADYDAVRQQTIESLGITVLRFRNTQVLEYSQSVLIEIASGLADRRISDNKTSGN